MNSYNGNKEKNKKVTFQEGRDITKKSNVQNSDYGSISNEIDSIIKESSHNLNIETKENRLNNQNVNVKTTTNKPNKKEEQVQILQQSRPTTEHNNETKIEEDLFEITLKNENKKTNKFPNIKIKKKDQEHLFPTENKSTLDSINNKKKSRIFKTNPTTPKNTSIQKKQEINQKIPKSKKSSLNLFSKNKKQKDNTKIQSDTPQKSPAFENLIEKPLNKNDPTYQAMDNNNQTINNDIHRLLTITDDLLGKLPEEVITEFASTNDFELYKQVMNKYQIGK
ncbi:hypothetical protein B6U98_00190 [Thermoplasmatales archaeon ex4572_165]|nr:MAG: hypothetical protein B6U98_00190 [Thermoplasmatales archaeon ex4572_165]